MGLRERITRLTIGAGAGAALALGALGVSGATLAVNAGNDWCGSDPPVTIQLRDGNQVTVYVTEFAQGPHQAALDAAQVSYRLRDEGRVRINDLIASDDGSQFATRIVVSSQPWGAGRIYGTAQGQAGDTLAVTFRLNGQGDGGDGGH